MTLSDPPPPDLGHDKRQRYMSSLLHYNCAILSLSTPVLQVPWYSRGLRVLFRTFACTGHAENDRLLYVKDS